MKTNIFKEENLFLIVFTKLMTSFIISLFITFIVSLLFGYKYMLVKTESMEPTIHVSELVILAPTKFEDLKIMDIITFKSSGEGTMNFTHRVRGVAENGEFCPFCAAAQNGVREAGVGCLGHQSAETMGIPFKLRTE